LLAFFVKQLEHNLSLSVGASLANGSKDCTLLAPRPTPNESQQSFNGKMEYDDSTEEKEI
jgi:hypothetical protein